MNHFSRFEVMNKWYLLLGFVSVVLVSCKKEATSWISAWQVPVLNDSLKLDNLVTDSILSTNGSGYYQLEINRNLLDINLSDYIEIPDTTVKQSYAISAGSFTVSPGTNFVANNKDHTFDLGDVQLKKARISKGKIYMTINSPVETKTIFTVQLPGVTKQGQMIQRTVEVNPGTNQNPGQAFDEVDLQGYDIDLTGLDGTTFNSLASKMNVKSDPNGAAISINNQDSCQFIVRIENLELDYARGYFGNLVVENTDSLEVEFLKNITGGSLDLPNTQLDFRISNGIKVAARATLNTISNTNSQNQTVNLTHPQLGVPILLEQATGNWSNFLASLRAISFTSNNSNIEEFVENLGSKIKLNYKLELNPYGNTSGGWDEFFPNSRLQVRLRANMPLSAGLNQLTFRDTFALNLASDKETFQFENGSLLAKVKNAFPIQGSLQLALLDEGGNLIELVNGSSVFASASQGSLLEGNLQVAKSDVQFVLSSETLKRVKEIKKVAVRAILDTPDALGTANTIVLIPEGAFISFKVQTQFDVKTGWE